MRLMNVAQFILDYVAICEKRRQLLDFGEFVKVWKAADALMETGTNAGLAPEDVVTLLIDDEG